MDAGVDLPPFRKKNQHDSCEFWLSNICDDIKWFYFQSVMMHTSNNMNKPTDILQSFFKVLLMFKMRIWYENNTVHKNVLDYLVIKCIKCGKVFGCSLDKRQVEYVITSFVTKCCVSACWFILDHWQKKVNFYFEEHFTNWVINTSWYNTIIC